MDAVQAVLRLAALMSGFVVCLAVLFVFTTVLPGAWLPIAYVVAASVIVARTTAPTFSASHEPFAVALAVTVFGLWSLSTDGTAVQEYPVLGRVILPAVAIIGLILIVRFAAVERQSRWLVPLLVVSSIIAFVSSDRGGSDPMVTFFEQSIGFAHATALLATLLIRKAIHFAFYGTVAYLAWRAGQAAKASIRHTTWLAILYPLALASFDERRQSSFRSRTGSIWDVVLDMAGALTVVFVLSRLSNHARMSGRHRAKRPATELP